MKFVRCPQCHRIKFFDKYKKTLWVKLCKDEEFCLDVIPISHCLTVLVDKFEEISEYCDECDLIEKN